MSEFNFKEHPHRRYNPLTNTWVLVSPHRSKRPWQGQVEKAQETQRPQYDPKCYLCPGNERAGGEHNPKYTSTYSFTNDFSALLQDVPTGHFEQSELMKADSQRGICRVICFSPRHDLTIPEMDLSAVRRVVDLWVEEFTALSAKDFINYVQIFENKGAMMGCSNPHPHGQIWSQSTVPMEPARKTENQAAYWKKHRRSMLGDYLKEELQHNERIITENDHFVALVPFWAVWPFEAMIVSRRHFQHLGQMTETEKDGLADIYKRLTTRYDNLFEISFPYSAGLHQCPTDGQPHEEWHFHACFYPPLLRSATVKKFMVGYEMLAEPQRDVTPEWSAAKLRDLSEVHYKKGT